MSGATVEVSAIDESSLVALAAAVAGKLVGGGVIHLRGELGAGKTTFVRALLQSLGVTARIKSPTYSLIESYQSGALEIHHLDLYRIANPGELDFLGVADLDDSEALMLIEWPDRGGAAIPPADLVVRLGHAGERRNIALEAITSRAIHWLPHLSEWAGLRAKVTE